MEKDYLLLELIRLKDEISECRAAIKDAAFPAVETPWEKWWLARYAALLPNSD